MVIIIFNFSLDKKIILILAPTKFIDEICLTNNKLKHKPGSRSRGFSRFPPDVGRGRTDSRSRGFFPFPSGAHRNSLSSDMCPHVSDTCHDLHRPYPIIQNPLWARQWDRETWGKRQIRPPRCQFPEFLLVHVYG